jgi:toxin ParE1/3/4
MKLMRRVQISDEAERDLISIGRYTEAHWGKTKRKDYLQSFNKCIGMLAKNPRIGSSREDICAGLYAWPHGSHLVFYRFDDETIKIGRILHARMDIAARLHDDADN